MTGGDRESASSGESAWDVVDAVRAFRLVGDVVSIESLVRGHIHDTFVVTCNGPGEGGEVRRYLHQRMNREVFGDIEGLMHNIQAVTTHLHARPGSIDALRLVAPSESASDGPAGSRAGRGSFVTAADGAPWRAYEFVEGTKTFDRPEGPEMAHAAAAAFGDFQARLTGLDPSTLHETIPDFFDSVVRGEQLAAAHAADAKGRAADVRSEMDFVEARRGVLPVMRDALRDGRMPPRVVHGDTKLNNVLFDERTLVPRCIVDLDTCMPGYALFDFGDLARFTSATAAEDERDLDQVTVDLDIYAALREGYLHALGENLNAFEREHMAFAARLVTLTIGMRFLADHIAGDRYFKIGREGHNLDRARVQFRLVHEMERRL